MKANDLLIQRRRTSGSAPAILSALALRLLVAGADSQAQEAPAAASAGAQFFDQPFSTEYQRTMVSRIVGSIDEYFARHTTRVSGQRGQAWSRDLSSRDRYQASIKPQRDHLARILGVVDERKPILMEYFGAGQPTSRVAETKDYTIEQVRWPVIGSINGEGLLLRPKGPVRGHAVALPDADQTPEQISGLAGGVAVQAQYARRLAESGIEVLVPALISRGIENSGVEAAIPLFYWDDSEASTRTRKLETNRTHRETAWRQAFVMGRHLIGYEIQKVLAGLDWFEQHAEAGASFGVIGYGEGGLLALNAAAIDPRIDVTLVSGYFGPREGVHEEPVERIVWGLLQTFGDAEIASLIAPRQLVIEYSDGPSAEFPILLKVDPAGDYFDRSARRAGQKGRLATPSFDAVAGEVARHRALFANGAMEPAVTFVHGNDGGTVSPGSARALEAFLTGLGAGPLATTGELPTDLRGGFDPGPRQLRQLEEIDAHVEAWLSHSDFDRYRFITGDRSSPRAWERSMDSYREHYYEEIIGRLPETRDPVDPAPQMRQVFDEEQWTGFEVVWNVLPGIKGWGLLAIPKNMAPGEKRPVMVTQHGAGGTPTTPMVARTYNRLLPQLCERGFVVFSPFAPYDFDVLRAMPLGASVYSIIIPQYQQMMRWLTQHEHVDAERIGYYGKSWGGRTALRVPPYIPEFKLAICSAFFNYGARKLITRRYTTTYMHTGSIGMYEFGAGITYGPAELVGLFAPRPFLVENGYFDNVKPDEWAGYEFTKVKRLYQLLGVGDRAVWGSHVGGHEFHADTVFPFIHHHLNQPVPPTR